MTMLSSKPLLGKKKKEINEFIFVGYLFQSDKES